jgi:asparagine synthase (glutamine-hydrolysing)
MGLTYLAWFWSTLDPTGQAADAALRRRLEHQPGWRVAGEARGGYVASPRTSAPYVRQLGAHGALVIGDLYRAADNRPAPKRYLAAPRDDRPEAWAELLLHHHWGRYIAVLRRAPGQEISVLRDPSGALECLVWTREGLTFVASEIPAFLERPLRPSLSIDWDGVARLLRNPGDASAVLPLDGLLSAAPGAWLAPCATTKPAQLWSPARFAAAAVAEAQAQDALRTAVSGCVEACGRRNPSFLGEISGGLDSAIVSGTLARGLGDRAKAWLNYATPDSSGDERHYAQAVADRFGLTLTVASKPELALDLEALEATQDTPRPSFNAFDPHYDQDVAHRCRQLGAQALITGQGGDAVFFQSPTPWVFADHLHRRGLGAFTTGLLPQTARWTRRSAWSIAGTALRDRLGGDGPPLAPPAPDFLAEPLRQLQPPPGHPWLEDVEAAPPAKRLHIRNIAYCLIFHGASRRGRAAQLLHPLLTQPVIETCLQIPVDILVRGGRDRALARAAFADRAPAAVLQRHSKGEVSAYYGRTVSRALPGLRAYLLDGELTAHGLLDPSRLDAWLTPETLAWRGGWGQLMTVVALEGWSRRWRSPGP